KLAVQRDLFFVALIDGVLAGTVMGGYDGHRGWVYSLAVRPEVRRRGVGTALMKHVEAELAKRGCAKVNLQVLASNAATVAFYRNSGSAAEGRVSRGRWRGAANWPAAPARAALAGAAGWGRGGRHRQTIPPGARTVAEGEDGPPSTSPRATGLPAMTND